jgi:MoxR-like ATPase
MSDDPNSAELLKGDIGFIRKVRDQVSNEMFGIDIVIDTVLVALITGGNVLLEGNPGLGKTALIKSLHSALSLPAGKTGRIQFTPDLMPSDITGTLMPSNDDTTRLEFKPGPIFTWLLLADEINRATPKTQAAMLEAMAEKQVTVLGQSRELAPPFSARFGDMRYTVRPPFMVMATQNPIDQEGTYNLPEAQADRFMFKIRMPFPDDAVLQKIMNKVRLSNDEPSPPEDLMQDDGASQIAVDETLVRIQRLSQGLRAADGDPLLSHHIRNILLISSRKTGDGMNIPAGRLTEVRAFVDTYIRYPLGPRAAFAMDLGARGLAAVQLVNPERPETLADHTPAAFARLCIPAIRHRLKLHLGWERVYQSSLGISASDPDLLQDQLLSEFVMLCAPDDRDYLQTLENSLSAFLTVPV